MSWIIKDVKAIEELRETQHGLSHGTFMNVSKGRPISITTYEKVCQILGRPVDAVEIARTKGFTIDLICTDNDLWSRRYKHFKGKSPEQVSREASDYLNNPDNAYDIFRDEQLLSSTPEINEDRDETLEGKLQDSGD